MDEELEQLLGEMTPEQLRGFVNQLQARARYWKQDLFLFYFLETCGQVPALPPTVPGLGQSDRAEEGTALADFWRS